MYKLTNHETIIRLIDNASIPADESNMDYRKYLEWLDEGNAPEPADPEPEIPASLLNAQDRMKEIDWQAEQTFIRNLSDLPTAKMVLEKLHQRIYAMARIMSLTIDELID